MAAVLLGIWAHAKGQGLRGPAQPWFFLSGCIGFGIGDMALYQALPRLGARLSMVLVHCLAAPCAALIEWGWLGTRMDPVQLGATALILSGVAVALAPGENIGVRGRGLGIGIAFGTVAALGQAIGAVISRKAFAMNRLAGLELDGGTAAYQRILGGLLVTLVAMAMIKEWRQSLHPFDALEKGRPAAGLKSPMLWVLANSLAGPTIGVSFFQLALRTTPSGLVLPIVATTPILVIPLAFWMEGDRPTLRSLAGGAAAVAGAVLLAMNR